MKRMMNKILTIPVCLILILIFMLPATAVSDSSITVILKNDDKLGTISEKLRDYAYSVFSTRKSIAKKE